MRKFYCNQKIFLSACHRRCKKVNAPDITL